MSIVISGVALLPTSPTKNSFGGVTAASAMLMDVGAFISIGSSAKSIAGALSDETDGDSIDNAKME